MADKDIYVMKSLVDFGATMCGMAVWLECFTARDDSESCEYFLSFLIEYNKSQQPKSASRAFRPIISSVKFTNCNIRRE